MSPPVAVIDIGSNSIKLLVAARSPTGATECLSMRSIDARISSGIAAARPVLGEEGMQRGLDAIAELLKASAEFRPQQTILVATSAVRSAANGGEFCARVAGETGCSVRILSGEEEARLIGRGLASDPLIAGCSDYHVFDLGGGSLECLRYEDLILVQALSLPLGCVRLMEKFAPDREAPLKEQTIAAIASHVRTSLEAAGFNPGSATPVRVAVGTGGTLSTVRFIEAARTGVSFEETSPVIRVSLLRELLEKLAALPLSARKLVAGLPPARADVFPTALATVVAVADLGGFQEYRNSLRNLRWGIAAEAFGFDAEPPLGAARPRITDNK